ncbi:ABC transporter ATP-binding protein [Pseudomonas sp. PSKL.D1]|uniref:ABC transporter ATP-binding protein n=1 Tax=Pseudomonas sp. PSKL.D1 TaxID=3029060 RepID=UPI002380DF75|nr:ABC transporter ATP-binding protein [Pseudomonas sp. PSKL.D1]WDY59828.1 ABC transporter ATP-binding protein [Pseudomonas sp. PSKL.D1]
MSSLHVHDLTVGYKRNTVLHGITLPALAAGELVALVGPNGAGKSTLLRSLAGLLPSAHGSVRFDTLDLLRANRRERAQVLGFMPQALPDGIALSVLETLLGALRGGDPRAALGNARQQQERAYAVLERLGILHLALRPLDALSGGQRQMVSLAQAVIRQPRLLLLDEPTSALDLRYQNDVMATARSLADEGRLVIVVLHDLGLAARWADRLVVLQNGHLHAAGPPVHTLTPRMLAEVYRVQARVEACTQGRVQILVDGAVS